MRTTIVKRQESEIFTFNQFSDMYVGQTVCQTRENTQFISGTHNNPPLVDGVSHPTLQF